MSTCGEMPAARERRTRPVAQEAIASHGAIVGNGRRGAGKTACQTGEIKACGQVEVRLRWASSAFERTDAPNANEAGLRRPHRTPHLNPMSGQALRRGPAIVSAPEPASLAAWRADQVRGGDPVRGRVRLQQKTPRKGASLRTISTSVAGQQQRCEPKSIFGHTLVTEERSPRTRPLSLPLAEARRMIRLCGVNESLSLKETP